MRLTPFSGGCACGAVRYECTARPLAMFNCHCKTCQKVTGGAYTPVLIVPAKAFRMTQGTLRYHFTDRVGGGNHKRGFCGDCGSRITGAETDQPGRIVGITASSLDDSSWFKPQFDIFASHAQ